jgi:hypothetical protein
MWRWMHVVQNDARSHNPLPGRSQRGRTRNQSFVHEEWAGSGEWVTSGWTGGQWGVSRRGELHWDSRHVKCRVGRHETQNKSWGVAKGQAPLRHMWAWAIIRFTRNSRRTVFQPGGGETYRSLRHYEIPPCRRFGSRGLNGSASTPCRYIRKGFAPRWGRFQC